MWRRNQQHKEPKRHVTWPQPQPDSPVQHGTPSPTLPPHQICHPAGTPLQRCLPFWAPINTTLLRFRILIALATVMHMVAAVIACPLILSFLISFFLFTQLGLISIQSCLLQSKLKTWLYILLQQLPNLLKALERAYLMSSFSCPHSLLNSLQVSFPSHHSITIAFSRSPVGSTGPNPLVNSQATYTPLPSGWYHLTATSQLSYILPPLSTSFHLCPQSNHFKYHLNPKDPLQIHTTSYEFLFELEPHFHLNISNSTHLKPILIFSHNLILFLLFLSQ